MKSVDIILFEGVDELDFCGAYEVLASCRKVIAGRWTDKPAFHVETVAGSRATIRTAHGLSILPDKPFELAREADIILVPGGPAAQKENISEHLLEFLRKASYTADVVASISTGAFLLAKAGLAFQQQVTTHNARTGDLARLYPLAHVVEHERVVISGDKNELMSCGGSSCGIDLALTLVARFEDANTAKIAARRIEWVHPVMDWEEFARKSQIATRQRNSAHL